MALIGFSGPGQRPRGYQPDPATNILNLAATGAALGWSPGYTYGIVATQYPQLAPADIESYLELAQAQIAAAAAYGTPDVYHRPRLADIPICPGCPPGQIETRMRVRVYDPTTGQLLTEGNVSCTYSAIPDLTDLAECADSWAEEIVERFYPAAGGVSTSWEVTTSQRGTFFGR